MKIERTNLPGVFRIVNPVFSDTRGVFVKTFHAGEFACKGLSVDFRESFFSISRKDVIRGMHFQSPPFDHDKLVFVIGGEVLDVLLNIQVGSPHCGEFSSFILSETNRLSLYIPKGYAHGFRVLSETATMVYLTTREHAPEHDAGIRWDSFGFDWGISQPIVSGRDETFPTFSDFLNH